MHLMFGDGQHATLVTAAAPGGYKNFMPDAHLKIDPGISNLAAILLAALPQ